MPEATRYYRGGSSRYREAETVAVVGAADDILIESDEVPRDELWLITSADIRTSDAGVPRNAIMETTHVVGQVGPALVQGVVTGTTIPISIDRALFLGAGERLVARVDALSVGAAITLRFRRLRLLHGEVAPAF